MPSFHGTLSKMAAHLEDSQAQYQLRIGEHHIDLAPYINQTIALEFSGNIFCSSCGKKTKKSYAQGHCFVCMRKLASCDMCIMKPETCHYDEGTCREPQWGEANCMTDHFVYLSNTSSIKVGITRHTQIPTRWIDQGATQALPIFKVKTRQLSGLIEVEIAKLIADKTNWRTLLKQNAAPLDLVDIFHQLYPKIHAHIETLKQTYGDDAIQTLIKETKANVNNHHHSDNTTTEISYPVTEFPAKITSHNFDKNPIVEGKLHGIKGQYLIFDSGVINIRKFSSYEVTLRLPNETL